MKQQYRKTVSPLLAALIFAGCTLTPGQQTFTLNAVAMANAAATAAATAYGGPLAGQLASSGLSALASVLEGYVGITVPKEIVAASPGIAAVGDKLAQLIPTDQAITQAIVDAVNRAAAIAANLKAADVRQVAAVKKSP